MVEEGLLFEQEGNEKEGKIYPYDEFEAYFYGYNNRYSVQITRAFGGPKDTIDADKGLYEISLWGIGLKPEELRHTIESPKTINSLCEKLSESEIQEIFKDKNMRKFADRYNAKKQKFNSISRDEYEEILEVIKKQKERQATHVVENSFINPYYSVEEEIKRHPERVAEPENVSEEEIKEFQEFLDSLRKKKQIE